MSHPRPVSLDHAAIARLSRPSRDHPLSSPPTVSSFHIPPSHTATHAGGILPSASFFRPSRPPHSRTTSPDALPRSHPSHESDSPSLRRPATQLKRSREPLLPLATPLPPPNPSDSRPIRKHRFCSGVTRVWRNPSLDSTHDVVPLSVRHSLHRPHSVHDISPLPRQSMFHPLVQIPSSRPPSSFPSPNHVFIPDPPKSFPPLSAIPSTPKMRIYQLYPSRNRFFCAGRLLTGGESPWAFIASLAVVIAITATWFSTTCVWWWQNESPAVAAVGAYMCLLTVSCMLATVSALRLLCSCIIHHTPPTGLSRPWHPTPRFGSRSSSSCQLPFRWWHQSPVSPRPQDPHRHVSCIPLHTSLPDFLFQRACQVLSDMQDIPSATVQPLQNGKQPPGRSPHTLTPP